MSTTTEQLRGRWGRKRFQRAMRQYQAIMETYTDKMETEAGQLALVLVSGIAHLVAHGLEPPAALADIIAQESIKSGISEAALEAHARFSSEMLACFEFDQQPNETQR